MGIEPSIGLVDDIVKIAGVYKGETHTGMEDIFPTISRYNGNLEQVDYVQLVKSSSNVLFDTMKTLIRKYGKEISCVVTAPPESFFLHMKFDGVVIMFDSHPRPHLGLKNSHFLIFDNSYSCEKYLQTALLKCVKLDVSDVSEYQLQAMNAFEANMLCLKKDARPDPTPNLEQLKKELDRVDFRLSVQFKHENKKFGNDYSDLKFNSNNNGKSQNNTNYNNYNNYSNNKSNKNDLKINCTENDNCSNQESNPSIEILRERLKLEREERKQQEDVLNSRIKQLENHIGTLQELLRNRDSSKNNNDNSNNNGGNNETSVNGELLDDFKFDSKAQNQFCCRLCTDSGLQDEDCWKPNDNRVVFSNCGCNFICRKCAHKYISDAIERKQMEIKCPTCTKPNNNINEHDIELIDGRLYVKYHDMLTRQLLNEKANDNQNKSWPVGMRCPNSKCNFHGSFETWIQQTYLICPRCKLSRFCKNCTLNDEFHAGFVSCTVARLRADNPKRFMQCANCDRWKENASYNSSMFLFCFVFLFLVNVYV